MVCWWRRFWPLRAQVGISILGNLRGKLESEQLFVELRKVGEREGLTPPGREFSGPRYSLTCFSPACSEERVACCNSPEAWLGPQLPVLLDRPHPARGLEPHPPPHLILR